MLTRENARKAEVKCVSTLRDDKTKSYIIKDNMVGIVDENGAICIPPKFYSINTYAGSYVCTGVENGKTFCEIYDSNFNRIK